MPFEQRDYEPVGNVKRERDSFPSYFSSVPCDFVGKNSIFSLVMRTARKSPGCNNRAGCNSYFHRKRLVAVVPHPLSLSLSLSLRDLREFHWFR